MHRLAELAAAIGGRVEGDGDQSVRDLRNLEDAGPQDLAPLFAAGYRDLARESEAGVLLVPEDHSRLTSDLPPRPLLVAAHPQLAMARVLEHLHPERRPEAGIHPTAVVEDGAELHPSVHVGPYAVIGAGSRLGEGVVVEALAVVGRDCALGARTRLRPHTVLYDGTVLGEDCQVHSGAVLGADGFGYASHQGVHHKVPQVGRTVIGDGVEVGALSAIDRGALGDTVIGPGSKIDNLVQVGHNVRTGHGVVICGQVGIGGSAILGDHVVLGGQSGVVDHRTVGDRTQVAGMAGVYGDLPADQQVGGHPAIEIRRWRRQMAVTRNLDGLARRVRALEKALEEKLARLDADASGPGPTEE